MRAAASIHYYESVGGRSRQISLCRACADQKGFGALVAAPFSPEASGNDLKSRLERAISGEDFEEAARLRDMINERVLS